jgi:hypothetical protein
VWGFFVGASSRSRLTIGWLGKFKKYRAVAHMQRALVAIKTIVICRLEAADLAETVQKAVNLAASIGKITEKTAGKTIGFKSATPQLQGSLPCP